MSLKVVKIFIASSAELKADREDFRIFISNQNDRLSQQGIYLQVVQWENFLDAISDTRLQEEYNKAMRECDIALCLFFTKVGKYTAEEFDTAYQVFKETGKPKIWTYFKNAAVDTGSITEDINTLFAFKKKIGHMGHFYTGYTNIDNLINQFRNQLDKVLPQLVHRESMLTSVESKPARMEPDARNAFNEILVRRLIESIKVYQPIALKFSNYVSSKENWQTQDKYSDDAKKIIVSSFVGVVGIQLRKLMAIGKESFSESKCNRYLFNCCLTAKRVLQVVCFSMLSQLWDYRQKEEIEQTPAQTAILADFFYQFEQDLSGFFYLQTNLYEVFLKNNLQFYIVEMKDFGMHLQAGSPFSQACEKLQALSFLFDRSEKISQELCMEAETALAVVLEAVSFLVKYEMMAVKSISYLEMRNQAPHYLHSYTSIGIDLKSDVANRENLKYEQSPIITDGVLLYTGEYWQSLNLFPFIIDMNALTAEGGAKICFYSSYNATECTLKYTFLEDNTTIDIHINSENNWEGTHVDINKLLAADPKKHKDIRLNNVYNLFKEAKKTIISEEEAFSF